jgi:hypothetical protein
MQAERRAKAKLANILQFQPILQYKSLEGKQKRQIFVFLLMLSQHHKSK